MKEFELIDSEDNDLREHYMAVQKTMEEQKGLSRPDGHGASWKFQAAQGMRQVLDQIVHKRKQIRRGHDDKI